MDKKSIITAVLSWAFAALCAVMAVMLFPSVGSVMLAVIGVLALPMKPIRMMWDKLLDFKGGEQAAAKTVGKASLLLLAAVVSLALSAKPAQPVVHPVNAAPADRGIVAAADDTVTDDTVTTDISVTPETIDGTTDPEVREYIINKNTKKFHLPTCSSVGKFAEKNREDVTASRDELTSQGYSPCGVCRP